ncbi:MAG: hypothetical protein ACLQMO_15470 [Acidobacteriaceae bacterium]
MSLALGQRENVDEFSSFNLSACFACGCLLDNDRCGHFNGVPFAENVNDANVRAVADTVVASGMRDAEYMYVNIDDTWEGQRSIFS